VTERLSDSRSLSGVVRDAPLRWGPNNMVITWTPDSHSIIFLLPRRSARNTEGVFVSPVTAPPRWKQ